MTLIGVNTQRDLNYSLNELKIQKDDLRSSPHQCHSKRTLMLQLFTPFSGGGEDAAEN